MKKVFQFFFSSLMIFITSPVWACAVCFKGDPGQLQNQGLRAGIVLLMIVLGFVIFAFISFFLNLIKKQKACELNGF